MHERIQRDIDILRRTPAVMMTLLTGLTEDWIETNEGEGTWSARDIAGHLLWGEETDWLVRAKIILEEGESTPFEPFQREGFRQYADMTLAQQLDTFAQKRTANLAELEKLDLNEKDLQRTGTHPDFGRVTLGQLIAAWVVHDLGHIAQIARVMAQVHKDNAGPWEKYLPILHWK